MTRPKPWRMEVGALIGLVVGSVLWWAAYESGKGPFQHLNLLLGPAAVGMVIANLRNRRRKVGPYDPEVIEKNRRGRF
ncbi:MAG TPA: hypothetical protein VIT45_08685 [Allosphingosinicella sp.]